MGFRGNGTLAVSYVLTPKFLDPPDWHSPIFVLPLLGCVRCMSRGPALVVSVMGFDVAGQIFAPARHLWTFIGDALPQFTDGTLTFVPHLVSPPESHIP